MRIPVNSCEGCNKELDLTSGGMHCMGDGQWMRCKFVDAELAGIHPPVTLLSVESIRRIAVRKANLSNAALLWCGQAPVEFWLVVR